MENDKWNVGLCYYSSSTEMESVLDRLRWYEYLDKDE